jgi:hypothetical protein
MTHLTRVPQGGIIAQNFGLRDVFIWAPGTYSTAKPLCPAFKCTGKNAMRQGYLRIDGGLHRVLTNTKDQAEV